MHYYNSKDVSLISSPPAVGAPPPPGLEPLGARVAAIFLNIVTIIIQTYCLSQPPHRQVFRADDGQPSDGHGGTSCRGCLSSPGSTSSSTLGL
jgi:hypothetical protein